MPLLRSISLAFLAALALSTFADAQKNRVIVLEDTFTRQHGGFTLVASPEKTYYLESGADPDNLIAQQSSYQLKTLPGQLIISHLIYDPNVCLKKRNFTGESDNIRMQLEANLNYRLVSEVHTTLGDFQVTKLKYQHADTGKITHIFFSNCREQYWLYGLSSFLLEDEKDPVIQAINSFQIVR